MLNSEEIKEAATVLIDEHRLPEGISSIEHAAITQLAGLYADKSIADSAREGIENSVLNRYEKEKRK